VFIWTPSRVALYRLWLNINKISLLKQAKYVCKISFLKLWFTLNPQGTKKLGLILKIIIETRRKGVWSQKFDACQSCKTREIKHFAKGLCRPCYFRAYRDMLKLKKELGKIYDK
jgi:hypothetical protein